MSKSDYLKSGYVKDVLIIERDRGKGKKAPERAFFRNSLTPEFCENTQN